MPRHIHVHLHDAVPVVLRDAGTSEGAKKAAQTRKSGGGSLGAVHAAGQAKVAASTKAPPSTVIKPISNAPHNPPKNTAPIKPARAASSVIKSVPHTAAKGIHLATKSVEGLREGIKKAYELSESKI